MSVKITDLGPVVLPVDPTWQLEVAVSTTESRRLAIGDLLAAVGGLDATFVTVTANPNLDNERILTAGTGITIVDGGAGNPITINAAVPPAGNLPTPTTLNSMLISDGVSAWLEAANLTYDNALSALSFAAVQAVGGGIIMQGALSTNYEVLTLRDQTGGNGFNLQFDYSLSAGNHRLNFNSDDSGELLQLEADGVIRFLGFAGDPVEIDNTGNGRLLVQNGATLFMEEIAAAQADQAAHGQLWVRNDTPNVLMFTGDDGVDHQLTPAGGGGTPGGANESVQFNNSGAFGGFGSWDGSTLEIPASQAAILLDETDGGGSCFIRLTSTTTSDSGIQLEFNSSSGVDAAIRQVTSGGSLEDTWITFMEDAGVGLRFNDVQKLATLATGVLFNDSLYIVEKAAANADTVGQGQVWVRDDTPNSLMFTDDAGTDFVIGGASLAFLTATQPTASITGDWTFSGNIVFTNVQGVTFDPSCEIDMRNPADDTTFFLQYSTGRVNIGLAGAGFNSDYFDFSNSFIHFRFGDPILILESAAAAADVAGYGQFWVLNTTPNEPMFTRDDGVDIALAQDLYANSTLQAQATLLGLDVRDTLRVGTLGSTTGNLKLGEQANADVDETGYGQFWVRDNTPNDAFFTDDAGNDFPLAYATPRLTINSSRNFNTAGNEAYNAVLFYDDGSNYTVTLEDSGSVVNWPVGVTIQINAPGSGVITIAEGSGTTLFEEDGTDTAAGGTLTQGSLRIFRASATVYILRGNGFTP